MDLAPLTWSLIVLVIVFVALTVIVRLQRMTIYEYQRGLRYREGRFSDLLGPGVYWIFKPTTFIRLVDMRTSFLPVVGQELVTSDGVTIKISLAVQRRLEDPVVAINEVDDQNAATYSLVQVALREAVAAMTVEDVLARRTEIGPEVLRLSHDPVRKIGVEIEAVDVKDLMLPAVTKKLLGQVMDARQRGLAALEKARGETAALRALANAARMVDANPSLLQLRLLEQLDSTSGNTVLLGMPAASTPLPIRQVTPSEGAPEPDSGRRASAPEDR